MKFRKLIASAFVIGRRDFTATVFSKAFLFFLLGPLFPILIGGVFGGIGARVASQAERPVLAFIGSAADADRLEQARTQIDAGNGDAGVVGLQAVKPSGDLAAQTKALLATTKPPVMAVLSGPLDQPHLTGAQDEDQTRQIALLVNTARTVSTIKPVELSVTAIAATSGRTASTQSLTARAAQGLLFVLTLLLAGMLLSQLIEEKSNKVIEVLAAAVPVDAIFLGKLFAMLAMSLVGIAVWATVAVIAVVWFAPGALSGLPAPAIGWPGFIALGIVYFAMCYLLIGAAFLGIGAQASTVREVQTLSMPVTMSQVVIFAIATAGADNLTGKAAIGAAIFPLSSPYAMVARAALSPLWWPHLVALAWQILWVAIILRVASGVFRRSVLKSGGGQKWWRRGKLKSAPVHSE